MEHKCCRNTKAGLTMEGLWNAYIMSMMGWGVGAATGHTGKAEWAPTEVGLESKAGKWKT